MWKAYYKKGNFWQILSGFTGINVHKSGSGQCLLIFYQKQTIWIKIILDEIVLFIESNKDFFLIRF